ncbi:hypothetical protein CDAR_42781 [Caerostris darwini]|uniref:Uncharacterized protein n=1 Tax=Caerostris darwini TaxID=1538125 RepID=A0AAV4WER4_9ARAC|nr:hypothetical protein CDAR_42781 [Caerostris darwini]
MDGGGLRKLAEICIRPFAPPFQSSTGNLLAREFDKRHCEIRPQHYGLTAFKEDITRTSAISRRFHRKPNYLDATNECNLLFFFFFHETIQQLRRTKDFSRAKSFAAELLRIPPVIKFASEPNC